MSTRASELESPKASGDALEAEIVQALPELEYVGDRTATWCDARTTAVLEARRSLPFYGIVLVEPETPVEIKGCQLESTHSTGDPVPRVIHVTATPSSDRTAPPIGTRTAGVGRCFLVRNTVGVLYYP